MSPSEYRQHRSDRRLLLFTKPPVPGRVKTRLIGELTPQQAARLHEAFLMDLLARLRRGAFDLRIAWATEGEEQAPRLGFPGELQRGADLGQRLFRVLAETLERCRALDLTVATLPEGYDVDVAADLVSLAERLCQRPSFCPRTRRTLADLGLLPAAASAEPPPDPLPEIQTP